MPKPPSDLEKVIASKEAELREHQQALSWGIEQMKLLDPRGEDAKKLRAAMGKDTETIKRLKEEITKLRSLPPGGLRTI